MDRRGDRLLYVGPEQSTSHGFHMSCEERPHLKPMAKKELTPIFAAQQRYVDLSFGTPKFGCHCWLVQQCCSMSCPGGPRHCVTVSPPAYVLKASSNFLSMPRSSASTCASRYTNC